MSLGSNNLPVEATRPGVDYATFAAGQNFNDDEGGGIDFRRYLSALVRHKWLIVGLTLAGTVAGFVASSFVEPVYAARARVQLPAYGRAAQEGPAGSAPLVQGLGWIELVQSFQVLDEVVRARRAYLIPTMPADRVYFANFDLGTRYVPGQYRLERLADGRLQLSSATGSAPEVAAVGDSLGRDFGFRWVPTGTVTARGVDFRVTSLRDASVALSSNLTTIMSRDGSSMTLTLVGSEPNETAETLNELVSRFISVATVLKNYKLTTVTQVLGEQLASARIDLQNAEVELQRFRVETITLPSDEAVATTAGLTEASPARQAFFKLRVDRDLLERDKASIERALAAFAADTSRSLAVSLGSVGSVRNSAELSASLASLTERRARLQQLRLAFAPGHPQIRNLETEISTLERQTIPSQARVLLVELQQQIGDVSGQMGASSVEMQQIPVRFTEEARRQRDVQVAQTIYTQVQSQYQNARLAEMSAAPDLRLLDSAAPPSAPETNQIAQIILLGVAGGLVLGLVAAILLDLFDSRIRYPDQVTRDLGLPVLGALPVLGKNKDGTPNREDVSALLEATRSIRMGLVYAHGTAGPFATTISSPGPGDGKSFTAANLAKAFAGSGRKTLLIDGDNRRGVLHRAFGVERKPGLTDFLAGTATLEDVVHSIAESGVDFIPTGTRMGAAPEMLASPKMQQLMAEFRTRYQAIILDSPPLGAGVDPLILASLTGSLVLVFRNGVTDRAFAGARLEALQRLPIRILGAILNDVRANEGMYRYYSYIPGYRSEDESESSEQEIRRIAAGHQK